ncbi:MAG: hypothetical protein AB7F86_10810 [Bdellovibrionales bacterium]
MKAIIKDKRDFNEEENSTWRAIMQIQYPRQQQQIHPMFMEGLKVLEMDQENVPDMDKINQRLLARTGWKGVFVEGLESGESFYQLLRDRLFPIGQFVRDRRDLNYTPAPDVIHDLYGHIPFLADKRYAEFCQKFAETACAYIGDDFRFRQFERFFWFTIEFGLIDRPEGRRIFGAGIASSVGECEYALGGGPEVLPFGVERLRQQEFRIDEMQKTLFVLSSEEQLYQSIDDLRRAVKSSRPESAH